MVTVHFLSTLTSFLDGYDVFATGNGNSTAEVMFNCGEDFDWTFDSSTF